MTFFVINNAGNTHSQKGIPMSALALDISNVLYKFINKLESSFEAFINSKFMKAYEAHARKRVRDIIARQTINELGKLTDKELNDIGIHRGEIYSIAYQTAEENENLKGWIK